MHDIVERKDGTLTLSLVNLHSSGIGERVHHAPGWAQGRWITGGWRMSWVLRLKNEPALWAFTDRFHTPFASESITCYGKPWGFQYESIRYFVDCRPQLIALSSCDALVKSANAKPQRVITGQVSP